VGGGAAGGGPAVDDGRGTVALPDQSRSAAGAAGGGGGVALAGDCMVTVDSAPGMERVPPSPAGPGTDCDAPHTSQNASSGLTSEPQAGFVHLGIGPP
jgi:hypothetical protein